MSESHTYKVPAASLSIAFAIGRTLYSGILKLKKWKLRGTYWRSLARLDTIGNLDDKVRGRSVVGGISTLSSIAVEVLT